MARRNASPCWASRTPKESTIIRVTTPPGCTELTRIPNLASSRAATLVMPRMANLLALYAESPSAPVNPSIEEMLTIEPPPALVIGSITAFMPSQQPTAFTSSTRRKSASGMSAIGANVRMPALFTSTSGGPNASVASATAAAQSASLVTSWWRYLQDSSPSWPATNAPLSSSTSPKTTRAPSATKCRTWDLPMPLAPPVISATLPSSRPMFPPVHSLNPLERVTTASRRPQASEQHGYRRESVALVHDIRTCSCLEEGVGVESRALAKLLRGPDGTDRGLRRGRRGQRRMRAGETARRVGCQRHPARGRRPGPHPAGAQARDDRHLPQRAGPEEAPGLGLLHRPAAGRARPPDPAAARPGARRLRLDQRDGIRPW